MVHSWVPGERLLGQGGNRDVVPSCPQNLDVKTVALQIVAFNFSGSPRGNGRNSVTKNQDICCTEIKLGWPGGSVLQPPFPLGECHAYSRYGFLRVLMGISNYTFRKTQFQKSGPPYIVQYI